MGMDDDAQIFSVIGGAKRSGRWRVPASTRTLTLFGRCLIDLRQAETTADELSFSCISAFAGVTFIVPEGAEVRPSGVAVLGSARSLVPVSDTPAHLPPISIDAITVLGRLRIRTTDEEPEEELRDSWRERRRARKAAKRAEKTKAAGIAKDPGHATTGAERTMAAVDDAGELVDAGDLRRIARPDETPALVDLKPVIRRPSISSPMTRADGHDDRFAAGTAAPELFERPRTPAPTVDPEPVGSIDDHPTPFEADETSPLEGLDVPDSAEHIVSHADTSEDR